MRKLTILLLAALAAAPLGAQQPTNEPAETPAAETAATPPAEPAATTAAETTPAAEEPKPAPRLIVAETEIDAGTVQRGEKIRVEFKLENQGDAELVIRNVQPACGCTVASYDRSIAAGKTGKVTAVVDTTNFTGPISKGVTVLSNDPMAPRRTLTVKAEILAHVLASPSYARFVHTQTLEAPTTGITVWSSDLDDFRVLSARSPVAWVTTEVREATEQERVAEGGKSQWRVTVSLADDAPVGQLREFLTVTTNHPQQPELEIPLSGVVRSVLHVTPAEADFGNLVLAGQARELVLRLINFGRDPVEVRGVTTDVEGISVRSEELEAGRKWRIVIEASSTLDKGKIAGQLRIETSSPVQPELEIPLRGKVG